MAQIKWDEAHERFYEAGVSKVVLYPMVETGQTAVTGSDYAAGVGWNGVTAINESTDGGDITKVYADNDKYLSLAAKEEFKFTIEAYTYPEEFEACDGSIALEDNGIFATNQQRKRFGLTYRTEVGEDVDGMSVKYKIHLVYECQAKPSSRDHQTINENPEAMTMSWECETTPIDFKKFDASIKNKTAHIIVSSDWAKCEKLEAALYGTDSADPYLPNPEGLLATHSQSLQTLQRSTLRADLTLLKHWGLLRGSPLCIKEIYNA